MATLVDRLIDAFETQRDARRAIDMAAYMRDQFPFLGIPTPERRALSRKVIDGTAPPSERELARVARRCWSLPEREYQYFACDYVDKHANRCAPGFLADLRWLITRKSWWDTVDALAYGVGALVLVHDELRNEIDAWIDDPNIWVARVALIHQLRFKTRTDAARLFGYCERRARDDEFFIRKAIGWALREYSKTDPRGVRAFVESHPELSPLSRREALRRIGA